MLSRYTQSANAGTSKPTIVINKSFQQNATSRSASCIVSARLYYWPHRRSSTPLSLGIVRKTSRMRMVQQTKYKTKNTLNAEINSKKATLLKKKWIGLYPLAHTFVITDHTCTHILWAFCEKYMRVGRTLKHPHASIFTFMNAVDRRVLDHESNVQCVCVCNVFLQFQIVSVVSMWSLSFRSIATRCDCSCSCERGVETAHWQLFCQKQLKT